MMSREVNDYMGMTPQQKAAYDQLHPQIIPGQGGSIVPRSMMAPQDSQTPPTFTMDDWNKAAPLPQQATRPAQTISQAEYMNLQRIHGPAGAAAFLRQHNIAIGN
jgi:hypothetical protein